MNVFGFYWLLNMLQTFSGFPMPANAFFLLVVCAFQGTRVGAMGWLHARATARGWPGVPVLLGAFVASELAYPLLFPWYYAATVHKVPALTQVAELGGPVLVGLVLLGANLALFEPILGSPREAQGEMRVLVGGAGARRPGARLRRRRPNPGGRRAASRRPRRSRSASCRRTWGSFRSARTRPRGSGRHLKKTSRAPRRGGAVRRLERVIGHVPGPRRDGQPPPPLERRREAPPPRDLRRRLVPRGPRSTALVQSSPLHGRIRRGHGGATTRSISSSSASTSLRGDLPDPLPVVAEQREVHAGDEARPAGHHHRRSRTRSRSSSATRTSSRRLEKAPPGLSPDTIMGLSGAAWLTPQQTAERTPRPRATPAIATLLRHIHASFSGDRQQ